MTNGASRGSERRTCSRPGGLLNCGCGPVPQTVQARRLLHQRSPRQPPCLHSLPVTSTSCVPVPASACAAHYRALPARSGLGGRPPCASGAPRQRLTPDSNCRALRPAGPIALAPGRARRAVASSTGRRSFAVCGAPRSGPTEFHSRLRVDWRAGLPRGRVPFFVPVAAGMLTVRRLRRGPDRWSLAPRWSSFTAVWPSYVSQLNRAFSARPLNRRGGLTQCPHHTASGPGLNGGPRKSPPSQSLG